MISEFETFSEALEQLFQAAKARDEFAYVFAILGINSGMEDAGWQPIAETFQVFQDLASLIATPLNPHTKTRLALLMYCQITEADYPYHVIYNMLISIEGKSPPGVFNFLDQYQNGRPPSAKAKVRKICEKAKNLKQENIDAIFKSIFNEKIRNAVSHADYILFNKELRLKHKRAEIEKIDLDDVFKLMNSAMAFFQAFFEVLDQHKQSYKNGHVISGRKGPNGMPRSSIKLKVHEQSGFLVGFSSSDPLPLW
jgi:hypothetical protein